MSSDRVQSLIDDMNSNELKALAKSVGPLVQQAEVAGADVELSPLSRGSNTPWAADDRDWFRANPHRACRRRLAYDGEMSGPGVQLIHQDELRVQVSFFLSEATGLSVESIPDDDSEIRKLMVERFARIGMENPLGPPRKPPPHAAEPAPVPADA